MFTIVKAYLVPTFVFLAIASSAYGIYAIYNAGKKSVETNIIWENYNDLSKADKIRDAVRECLASGRVYENGGCK